MSSLKKAERGSNSKVSIESTTIVSRLPIFLGIVFIAGLVFLCYWPAIHGGFLLDDDLLLTDNALVKAPDGLSRIWFTKEAVDYWPVTNSAFWVQWRLWKLNPTGYHVTNIVVHVANCLLVWLLLARLNIPGAFLGAVLYAVHPVNVEGVAWISQLKNVLSLLFFLISLVAFLNALEPAGETTANSSRKQRKGSSSAVSVWNRWYWFSLFAFTLAMLSKGSVAILPVLLLLIVWYRTGSMKPGDVWRTVPFFAVAVLFTLVNIWFQQRDWGNVVHHVTFAQRLLGAGAAVWFYLYKAIFPISLSFVYPQWNIVVSNPLWWLPLAASVLCSGLLLWGWWTQPDRKLTRYLLLAWIAFVVSLAPVLGFVDIGFMAQSLVADRYLYIGLIVVLALAAGCWGMWRQQLFKVGGIAAMVLAIAAVAAAGSMTWQQCHIYQDAMSLYQGIVDKNPRSWMAQHNLGLELAKVGKSAEAIEHYEEALKINPNVAEAYNSLGLQYFDQGDTPKAMAYYEHALKITPQFPEAHYNLGIAMQKLERADEAVKQFEIAVRLKPSYPEALNNLGNELNRAGRLPEAINRYRQALQLEPDIAETHYNLGNALENSNQPAAAVEEYRTSLRIDPRNAEALANLAAAYGDLNRWVEAKSTGEKALELARSQDKKELVGQIEAWMKTNSGQHGPEDSTKPPGDKSP